MSAPTAPRKAARVKGARADVKQSTNDEQEILGATPLPAAQITETGPALSGAAVVFGALMLVGMLMLAASAVPPRRVPWPVVAEPLFLHRTDLATLGVGTIAVAFLCLNAAVFL